MDPVAAPQAHSKDRSSRRGASLIEACLALALICLIFLGLFQVSRVLAARDTLNHAAARAARARTVGFNRWMVRKVAHVAAIPNAGRMLEPVYQNNAPHLQAAVAGDRPGVLWDRVLSGDLWPLFTQANIEAARIPEYLGAANIARARYILDYEEWDHIVVNTSGGALSSLLTVRVSQDYPMQVPLSRTFYASSNGRVPLEGKAAIENHYPLYLEENP